MLSWVDISAAHCHSAVLPGAEWSWDWGIDSPTTGEWTSTLILCTADMQVNKQSATGYIKIRMLFLLLVSKRIILILMCYKEKTAQSVS